VGLFATPLQGTLLRKDPLVYAFQQTECSNAKQGEPLPIAYPPANWALINQYYARNSTDRATSCSTGSDADIQKRYVKPGCGIQADVLNAQFVVNSAVTAVISYANANCTGLLGAAMRSISRSNGLIMILASAGGVASLPVAELSALTQAYTTPMRVMIPARVQSPRVSSGRRTTGVLRLLQVQLHERRPGERDGDVRAVRRCDGSSADPHISITF
jgi:hypothetical protein